MFNKKNIIRGLLLLDGGIILGKIITLIPSSGADKEIFTFADNLIKINPIFEVPYWLIYLTALCAIIGSYLTIRDKLKKERK